MYMGIILSEKIDRPYENIIITPFTSRIWNMQYKTRYKQNIFTNIAETDRDGCCNHHFNKYSNILQGSLQCARSGLLHRFYFTCLNFTSVAAATSSKQRNTAVCNENWFKAERQERGFREKERKKNERKNKPTKPHL